jgi:hypothetical protein
MKNFISVLMILYLSIYLFACSGQRAVSLDNPIPGKSVRIIMKSGKIYEGILVNKDTSNLKYINNLTHRAEELYLKGILRIEPASTVYDLEAFPIREEEISSKKGIVKTIAYATGGTVLGAGLVFVTVSLWAKGANKSIPEPSIYYGMGAAGLAGGIFFGLSGNKQDRSDAIRDIQKERYNKTEARLKKALEEEKKKLEEKQNELETLKQEKK